MTPDFYYLESDGQVFLLKDKKTWRFPKSRAECPCAFTPVFPMPIDGKIVLFAKPKLTHHPHHWFHKDEIVGRANIDPVVLRAVNRSLPRAASKVALIEKGKVLMVCANRGITKGMWNLPGGFIGYGEHPEASVQRECQEEIGARIKIIRLLGIYAQTFERTGGYMISFVYLGKRLTQTLRPHPDEIDAIAWMPVRQALRSTLNPFAKAGLRDYLKKPRP